jgi:hypothetical protein
MALAIRLDQLIREETVADQADLARFGRVSRARLTQKMNLLNLAPAIQEKLLQLQPDSRERDRLSERCLRGIVAESNWDRQRRKWDSRQNVA